METRNNLGGGGVRNVAQDIECTYSREPKALFHGREAGFFDIEHTLCKVARKQGNMRTKSPKWLTPTTKKGRMAPLKRLHEMDSDDSVTDGSWKRRKVIRNNPK